jgi:glycogen synthase
MTADTVGGVWSYATELAKALANVEIALATMGAALRPDQRAEAARLDNVELYESTYRLEWMDDPWEDVARAGEWLLDLEAWVKPDLIHLNGYAHGALPWAAPVLVVGHSCVLSWWEAVKGEAAPSGWERYRLEVGRGLRAADLVVAPTATMLAALQKYYGPLKRARVLPNGRSSADFPPKTKEPFIFAAGRLWDEAKNIGSLAKAAPSLPWPIYVAGEAEHPEGGRAAHANLHLLGRLARRELASWYGRAAVYALPARYEPFGLSALEAALAGCALVLGNIPSLHEVWDDAAVFVPPDDHEALAVALASPIADSGRLEAMAEHARRRALLLTPKRMAEGYLSAYQGLTQVPVRS